MPIKPKKSESSQSPQKSESSQSPQGEAQRKQAEAMARLSAVRAKYRQSLGASLAASQADREPSLRQTVLCRRATAAFDLEDENKENKASLERLTDERLTDERRATLVREVAEPTLDESLHVADEVRPTRLCTITLNEKETCFLTEAADHHNLVRACLNQFQYSIDSCDCSPDQVIERAKDGVRVEALTGKKKTGTTVGVSNHSPSRVRATSLLQELDQSFQILNTSGDEDSFKVMVDIIMKTGAKEDFAKRILHHLFSDPYRSFTTNFLGLDQFIADLNALRKKKSVRLISDFSSLELSIKGKQKPEMLCSLEDLSNQKYKAEIKRQGYVVVGPRSLRLFEFSEKASLMLFPEQDPSRSQLNGLPEIALKTARKGTDFATLYVEKLLPFLFLSAFGVEDSATTETYEVGLAEFYTALLSVLTATEAKKKELLSVTGGPRLLAEAGEWAFLAQNNQFDILVENEKWSLLRQKKAWNFLLNAERMEDLASAYEASELTEKEYGVLLDKAPKNVLQQSLQTLPVGNTTPVRRDSRRMTQVASAKKADIREVLQEEGGAQVLIEAGRAQELVERRRWKDLANAGEYGYLVQAWQNNQLSKEALQEFLKLADPEVIKEEMGVWDQKDRRVAEFLGAYALKDLSGFEGMSVFSCSGFGSSFVGALDDCDESGIFQEDRKNKQLSNSSASFFAEISFAEIGTQTDKPAQQDGEAQTDQKACSTSFGVQTDKSAQQDAGAQTDQKACSTSFGVQTDKSAQQDAGAQTDQKACSTSFGVQTDKPAQQDGEAQTDEKACSTSFGVQTDKPAQQDAGAQTEGFSFKTQGSRSVEEKTLKQEIMARGSQVRSPVYFKMLKLLCQQYLLENKNADADSFVDACLLAIRLADYAVVTSAEKREVVVRACHQLFSERVDYSEEANRARGLSSCLFLLQQNTELLANPRHTVRLLVLRVCLALITGGLSLFITEPLACEKRTRGSGLLRNAVKIQERAKEGMIRRSAA